MVKKQPHNHSATREHSHKQQGRLPHNPIRSQFHPNGPHHENPRGHKPARDYVLSWKNS